MHDKKKIHPSVSKAALKILENEGIKPSEAIERYALLIVTNKNHLMVEQNYLLERKKDLESEIKKRNESLDLIDEQLKRIDKSLDDFIASESKNMQNALQSVMAEISSVREEVENGEAWGKKVSLDSVTEIAESNNVSVKALLNMINTNVKINWIKDYDKL